MGLRHTTANETAPYPSTLGEATPEGSGTPPELGAGAGRGNVDEYAFGRLLAGFRVRAGFSQLELARRLDWRRELLSNWERGANLPSHRPDIKVIADMLDLSEEEYQQLLAAAFLPEDQTRSRRSRHFRKRRFFVPSLLQYHISRGQVERDILSQLTGEETETQALILHGLSGIGKTILACAVAWSDEVTSAFHDGVLWVDAAHDLNEDDFERLCQAVRQKSLPGERWSDSWRQWESNPKRHFLLVIDDLAAGVELDRLLAGLGTGSKVLVTTQDAEPARAELSKHIGAAHIHEMEILGLETNEAQTLVGMVIGHPLRGDEKTTIRALGQRLGWHPEALRLAANEARNSGWAGLQAELDSTAGMPLRGVVQLVERQWQRLSELHRSWLRDLLRWSSQGVPFGMPYAVAVWNVEPDAAERRLSELTEMGLLERLEATHDPIGLTDALWRVAPVIYRTLRDRLTRDMPTGLRGTLQKARIARRLPHSLLGTIQVPWQFRAVTLIWFVLLLPVNAMMWAVTGLVRLLTGSWNMRHRYQMVMLMTGPERHLQNHWERAGVQLTEELVLIYEARAGEELTLLVNSLVGLGVMLALGMLAQAPAFDNLVALSLLFSGMSLAMLFMAVQGFRFMWQVAWRVWLAHLYGLKKWDLTMLITLAHALGMEAESRD